MHLQKHLRRPSTFLVQKREEFPFRIELGRGAEIRHHLAGDAVDAHAGPSGALAVAGIGDLPEQSDHPQLLQQHGVEGHFIQTIQNLGRGARRSLALDRVNLNENSILRFALPNEGRQRGIARIAAVPIGLAVNFYRLKHGGQTAEPRRTSGVIALFLNT
jgi:hypothetical protein